LHFYLRVSTVDQHPETQLHDLQGIAAQRGSQVVKKSTDTIRGSKAKRPNSATKPGQFDAVIVWAFDLMSRSVQHLLETLDQLNHLGIDFISFRENIDTSGPLGMPFMAIVGASPNWKGI
jgi:DNA invertase Pin-like site-specific DNA recombinase